MRDWFSAAVRLLGGGKNSSFGGFVSRNRRRRYEPDLSILRLEQRRLLNADFSLVADALELNFTDPQSADAVTVSRDGDAYRFEIANGQWSGDATPGVMGQGADALLIDISTASGLSGGIRVMDDGDLSVLLAAADFSVLLGGMQLWGIDSVESAGGPFDVPTLSIISQAETPFHLTNLQVGGDLDITAATGVDDSGGDGELSVAGNLSITTGVLLADHDDDGDVDDDDDAIWRANFGAINGPGDANGDGVTNGVDRSIWRELLGRQVEPSASLIDIGAALDVQVTGDATFDSPGGGDIRVGVTGDADDSGKLVELGSTTFNTAGDVQIVEDSTDGLRLAGDNTADDTTLKTTASDLVLGNLTVENLTAVSRGDIFEDAVPAGGMITIREHADLTAGFVPTISLPADFDADGVVDGDDYTIWRANFGATTGLGDANSDGATNAIDYAIWRETLGDNLNPAGDAITLGAVLDLTIGRRSTFVSAAGGPINIGNGFIDRNVQLDTVRFTTTAAVEIIEDSADGFSLRRDADVGSSGSVVSLFTTTGDLQLDSITTTGLLSANSAGAITDAPGAQITAGDPASGFDATAATDIILADDATDALSVTGRGAFDAAGDITIGQMGDADFGSIALDGDEVVLRENSSTSLAGGTTRTLDVTSAGNIGNDPAGMEIRVTQSTRFATTTPGDDIAVGMLNASGPITLETIGPDGDASIANAGVVDLATSNIGGVLDVTAQDGAITDSGVVTVAGTARLVADGAGGDIALDTLAVAGGLSVHSSSGDVLLTNATAIDFILAEVGGDLTATALSGNLTNSAGPVTIDGAASFVAVAPNGAIDLGRAHAVNFGTLSLNALSADVLESSNTQVDTFMVDTLVLESTDRLENVAGATINVTGDATFMADLIALAVNPTDTFDVGGHASLTATDTLTLGSQ